MPLAVERAQKHSDAVAPQGSSSRHFLLLPRSSCLLYAPFLACQCLQPGLKAHLSGRLILQPFPSFEDEPAMLGLLYVALS